MLAPPLLHPPMPTDPTQSPAKKPISLLSTNGCHHCTLDKSWVTLTYNYVKYSKETSLKCDICMCCSPSRLVTCRASSSIEGQCHYIIMQIVLLVTISITMCTTYLWLSLRRGWFNDNLILLWVMWFYFTVLKAHSSQIYLLTPSSHWPWYFVFWQFY